MRAPVRTAVALVIVVVTASTFAALAPAASAAPANVWGSAVSLEVDPFNSTQARVAVGPAGDAVAVWVQATGTSPFIEASTYSEAGSWGASANVSWGTIASLARVVAVGDYRFLVAWVGNNNISVNWYTVGTGWSGPSLLYDAGATVGSLALSANSDGRAAVAWTVTSVFAPRVQVAMYAPGFGFSAPSQVTSLSNPNGAAVGVGEDGSAVVVWRENAGGGGTLSHISAASFAPAYGWSTTSVLTPNYPNANFTDLWPAVAVAPDGRALMVSRMQLGTPLLTARFEPGSGWVQTDQIVPMFAGIAVSAPTIDMDDMGNALVPLTEFLPNGTYGSEYFYYQASDETWNGYWTPGSGFPSGQTAAALDPQGRALITWTEDLTGGFSSFTARALRFLPGVGYQPIVDLGAHNGSMVTQGRMAVDLGSNGAAAIVWIHNSGTVNDVFGAGFVRDDEPPSLSLSSQSTGATNVTSFTVAGATDTDATVLVRGDPVTVDPGDGSFSTQVTLSDGPHTFTVAAYDAELNAHVLWITIIIDTLAPALNLAGPANNANVNVPIVVFSGVTEPGAALTVGGMGADVAPSGSFAAIVTLAEGWNTVTLVSTDAAGNSATRTVMVEFTMPAVAGLAEAQAQLAAANASLAAANASLAAAEQELATANAEVDAALAAAADAQTALAAARADANASAADLAAAEDAYDDALANLTAAEAAASASSSRLAQAEVALAASQVAYTTATMQLTDLGNQLNATRRDLDNANASMASARQDAASAQTQAAGASALAAGALLVGLLGMAVGIMAMRRTVVPKHLMEPHERGREDSSPPKKGK